MSENSEVEPSLECPFCRTNGIKYGALVCKDCGADISYISDAVVNRRSKATRAAIWGLVGSVFIIFGFGILGYFFLGFELSGGAFWLAPLMASLAGLIVYSKQIVPEPGTQPGSERITFRRSKGPSVIVGMYTEI